MSHSRSRAGGPLLNLGIITDEHLGFADSRKGGFGWASQQVGQFFKERPELGVQPIIINCERTHGRPGLPIEIEGVPVIWRTGGRLAPAQLKGQKIDLLLSIDYRPNYRIVFAQKPFTPAIVWVRDPWGPEEHRDLLSLRLPGRPDESPQGIAPPDHRSMRQVWKLSRFLFRKLLFATTATFLRQRVPGAYNIPAPEIPILPNLLTIRPDGVAKSARPSVIFLARMDPVKRPWLFTELARDFPEVDFLLAGKNHFTGPGSWQPENLAPNVKLLGHIEGEEKRRVVASAWVLINTSIHEGLPVSMQETLACGVPQLSTLDPEQTTSRFGIFVGKHGGDGLAALPALREGLRRLITDHALRERLGTAGRAWVTSVHNPDAFLASFQALCRQARRPIPGAS